MSRGICRRGAYLGSVCTSWACLTQARGSVAGLNGKHVVSALHTLHLSFNLQSGEFPARKIAVQRRLCQSHYRGLPAASVLIHQEYKAYCSPAYAFVGVGHVLPLGLQQRMSCMPFLFWAKRHKSDSPADPKFASTMTAKDEEEITRKLGLMSVRDEALEPRFGNTAFIGGFHPAVSNGRNVSQARYDALAGPSRPRSFPTTAAPPAPGPLPKPPVAMPVAVSHANRPPLSRTMQHALSKSAMPPHTHSAPYQSDLASIGSPVRPSSDPILSISASHPLGNHRRPPSTPKRPIREASGVELPALVTKSVSSSATLSPSQVQSTSRARSRSSPPSPSASKPGTSAAGNKVQCKGMTKAGVQCKRLVVVRWGQEEDIDIYCRQHVNEVLKPSQFPTKKNEWVTYKDWIPEYLHPLTQATLRAEMEKALSSADEWGFIYMFEIRDPEGTGIVSFKVGRTIILNKRIDQWSKQCPSKEQYLRYYWPWPSNESERTVMKGRVQPGDPGPWCHRLERLIHLELADLAQYAPYLDIRFPNMQATMQEVKLPDRKPCVDCGAIHQEIFRFPRAIHGKYEGREWEMLIKPVIEKWGRFVARYMSKD